MNTGYPMIDMIPPWFWAMTVTMFGLTIGSFLNVVIYRVPNEMSIVTPRSKCPNCEHEITALENIPVISYLLLGGKCRGCKDPISLRYPFVEILTAGGFLLAFYKQLMLPVFNIPEMLIDAVFIATCISLIFIDYDHYILPDVITKPGALLAVVARIFVHNPAAVEPTFYALQFAIIIMLIYLLFWALGKYGQNSLFKVAAMVVMMAVAASLLAFSNSILEWYANSFFAFASFWVERIETRPVYATLINGVIGATLGAGVLMMLREVYLVVKKIEGMGLGDVKMMLLVGFFLGWQLTVATLMLAAVLGTILSIGFFVSKGRDALRMKIPFGVFLGMAAIILTLFGKQLVEWYVNMVVRV